MNADRWAAGCRTARIGMLAAALAGACLPAAAQYKVVAPDGSVTYTDRPPAGAEVRVTPLQREPTVTAPQAAAATSDGLPPALRRTASRYPVTLYGTNDCPPCEAGRQLLQRRGVPFTEKLIVTDEDVRAMERTLGLRTVPTLTIGAQALRGLAEDEWAAYLDAAGYPRESQLPRSWQAPAAAPLTVRAAPVAASEPASAPAQTAAPQRAARPPAPAALPPADPSGIRF